MSNPDLFNAFTARDLPPITPDDNNDLAVWARAIRCSGAGGALRITTMTDQIRNTNITSGGELMVQVKRVHATGTTATGLEAMI